jgi:hypothetical protein
MGSSTNTYITAMIELAFLVGLQFVGTHKYEQIALPGNPNVKTIHMASLSTWRTIAMNPIWNSVTDADAEMLMADEAKRQLYADLVEHTLLPPLREFANVVATKMHLASLFNIAKLDKMLPGLGQSWACKGTQHQIFVDQTVYARQFEAASARMQDGDWSMLCPTIPDMAVLLGFVLMPMKEAVSKKERALLGASSGTGTAASTAFMAGGGEGETAEAET